MRSAAAGQPATPADLKLQSPRALGILRRNVYGWFVRVDHGVYGLTTAGHAALQRWPQSMPAGV